MRLLKTAALATWEFVVGDDWRTPLGVCAALALVALLAAAGVSAWWVMPFAVPCLLWASLRRFASDRHTD